MKYIYIVFEKNLINYGTTNIGNTGENGINICLYILYMQRKKTKY